MASRKSVIGYTALFLGIVVAAAVALVLYLGRNLDTHLEQFLSGALEREVRIEKGISLHWSGTPGITLKGLQVGNPEWAAGPYLVRAERATVSVNLSALWQRRLEVEQVSVQQADVALEQTADGRRNWTFGNGSGDASGFPVHALKIEQSRLSFRSPEGVDYLTDISDISYTGSEDGKFDIGARFAFRDARITVSTSGEKPQALSGPWPVEGRIEMPDLPPSQLAARVERTDCCLLIKQLTVTSGESDISGELSIPLQPGGRIGATLSSKALDLNPYAGRPAKAGGDSPSLLAYELNPGIFDGLDGAVQLTVGRLRFPTLELDQVEIDADVKESQLKLNVGAENRRITANIGLKPTSRGWQVSLRQKGKLNLGELINRAQSGHDETRAPLEIDLNLKGTGKSLSDLPASANGQFLMVVGEGKLSKSISEKLPLGDVIYTLLGAILPDGQNADQSKLECAVVQFDVAKGVATSSKGLALRTGQLNVLGGGAVNLRTGKIQFRFKTAPRRGLGIGFLGVADRLFDVTGTLKHPTAALSMERSVTFGAVTWATSGLNILANSLLSRLSASTNPCDTVLHGGK